MGLIDKPGQWFLESFLLIVFITFIFAMSGIEFNEYPHKVLFFNGYSPQKFDNLIICPILNGSDIGIKLQLNLWGDKENCDDDAYEIYDLDNNKINFYENYKIIIREAKPIDNLLRLAVEVIYLDRSLILVKGKGYP